MDSKLDHRCFTLEDVAQMNQEQIQATYIDAGTCTKCQAYVLGAMSKGQATAFKIYIAVFKAAPIKPITFDEAAAVKQECDQVLNRLTYRERKIFRLYHGIDDNYNYTLEEVSRIFQVPRTRVRHVDIKVIHMLKHPALAPKLALLHSEEEK